MILKLLFCDFERQEKSQLKRSRLVGGVVGLEEVASHPMQIQNLQVCRHLDVDKLFLDS